MNDCAPTSIPLPSGLTLLGEDCPKSSEDISEMTNIPYQEAFGTIMWLQVATRPDLLYAVQVLSRFAHNPAKSHWNALKYVMFYIKGTLNYEITYEGGGNLNPIGYVDLDYTGCKNSRKLTEDNVFIVAGGPVSWECKQQGTVALSTVETQYMGFTYTTTQAIWLTKFFSEIGLPAQLPIKIFADNKRSIANTTNGKNHQRIKHIDVKYHFTKQQMEARAITFEYTPSSTNLADIFTKPLPQDTLRGIVNKLGLIPEGLHQSRGYVDMD